MVFIPPTLCIALLTALLSYLGSASAFYDSVRSLQDRIGISGNASHGQGSLPWAAAVRTILDCLLPHHEELTKANF
jgi:hypothetical protein